MVSAKSIKFTRETLERNLNQRYEDSIRRGMLHEVRRARRFLDVTKIKPKLSEDIVKVIHERYESCFREGDLYDLGELCKITGIKPEEELVKKIYSDYTNNGKIDDLIRFYEAIGIKPKGKEIIAVKSKKGAIGLISYLDSI